MTNKKKKSESKILAYLRDCFLTGILVTAPIALSLYFVGSLLVWVDDNVGKFLPPVHILGEDSVPGLGVIIAVLFFVLIGASARNFLGTLLLNVFNYIMNRVPFVKTIYGALKQVFEMLMGKQAQAFREVVLVEFPRKDCWTLAFVAGKTEGDMKDTLGEGYVNIYVPTTPNPTSGYLIVVPESDVKRVNMTVDEGLKAVVSCGLIMPKEKTETK